MSFEQDVLPSGDDTGDAKDDVITLITDEMNSVKRRLSEIKGQIENTRTSVKKGQRKYSNIATELQRIKDNLDTVPREDIRDKYEDALNMRFRLATMSGQLEKFEAYYDYFEKEQQLFATVLSSLQGFEVLPDQDNGDDQQSGKLDMISIIQAQEDERKRLSRAMHDGPAQSLTTLVLQAEICQRLFNRNPDKAAEELDNLKASATSTYQKIRGFIFDLRPMMLDDLGVWPTIRRYMDSFQEDNDIEIKLDISGKEERMENYLEMMIFRSIQNVMVLTRDYASAAEMNIEIDIDTPLRITIEDDGREFDAEDLSDDGNEEGGHTTEARVQGLQMLKRKLELIGGKLTAKSDQDEGSTIRIELPIGDSTN